MTPKEMMYQKRGEILVKNLRSRHFDAYYCANREIALETALSLIPQGASVGWGGTVTCQEIGLIDGVRNGNFHPIDRDKCATPEAREEAMRAALFSDVFLSGANAMSLDGQMVNIDGTGNRVAAIIYGPKTVLVVAGMNKVCDSLEEAIHRARSVASPMNCQRFAGKQTPCSVTGTCADCKSVDCICNQIVITRHCRPEGRIKFIIVGEDLGF